MNATSPRRGRIVVLGIVGRSPFAGVGWQALHYLEGFRRLGYEVWYVEDTGEWPYDAGQETVTADERYTVDYIGRLMAWGGLPDRWAFRSAAKDRFFGPAADRVRAVFRDADALVNLTGATILRDEHLRVPVRIYLETDPVLPQIEAAEGRRFTLDLLGAHTHHFTFGENLGAPDCGVPSGPFAYRPTRQPVVIDWWRHSSGAAPDPPLPGAPLTTVASWKQSGKDIEWRGELYLWSKHHEFLRFVDLPRRTPERLELALACRDPEVLALLRRHGWRVRDAIALTRDLLPYRDYVQRSRGEFTVAKDQYVRLRSGWFSDRSACYLAAGRPVITQETGFSNVLPTGKGLFAFTTLDDVLAALDSLAADYRGHCRAAAQVAAEHFAAEAVVGRLCEQSGL